MIRIQTARILLMLVALGMSAINAMGGDTMGPMIPASPAPLAPAPPIISSTSSFGMTNGMAASPVVGDDGTAYLVTFDYAPGGVTPLTPNAPMPIGNTFQSTIIAVTPAGSTSSIKLKGIISRPAVLGSVLVATASLPDITDYMVIGNFGNQSVLYVMSVPFLSLTKPLALTMDGYFASEPVMAAQHIYVVTSDYGLAVMNGNPTFSTVFGNYNFNNAGTAHTYLYIFNLNGTMASRTIIQ